jgi:hypothetical protein
MKARQPSLLISSYKTKTNMIWLTDNELKKYGKTYSLSKKAIALVNHQKPAGRWPLPVIPCFAGYSHVPLISDISG